MSLKTLIAETEQAVLSLEANPGTASLQSMCRHSRDAWDMIFTTVSLTGEIPIQHTTKLIELIDRASAAAQHIDDKQTSCSAVPVELTLANITSRKPELLELVAHEREIESVDDLSVFH